MFALKNFIQCVISGVFSAVMIKDSVISVVCSITFGLLIVGINSYIEFDKGKF